MPVVQTKGAPCANRTALLALNYGKRRKRKFFEVLWISFSSCLVHSSYNAGPYIWKYALRCGVVSEANIGYCRWLPIVLACFCWRLSEMSNYRSTVPFVFVLLLSSAARASAFGAGSCCKICRHGKKPCGDQCVDRSATCFQGGGCACSKRECCKLCDKGQPCGDSCISQSSVCKKGHGCACYKGRGGWFGSSGRGGDSHGGAGQAGSGSGSGSGGWWAMLPKGAIAAALERLFASDSHEGL